VGLELLISPSTLADEFLIVLYGFVVKNFILMCMWVHVPFNGKKNGSALNVFFDASKGGLSFFKTEIDLVSA
jgi:hypothetical protein